MPEQHTLFVIFVDSLAVLGACMLLGYLGRKLGFLTDGVNAAMSTLLVKVTLPCTVFVSMMRPFSRALLQDSLLTLLLAGAVFLVGFPLATLLARLMKAADHEKRVWQFALVFGNVGYMGFPVTQAVFGYEALIYTSMANVAFNVLAFSLGIYLFKAEGAANFKKMLLNPALVAIYVGFIFFVTGLRLPGPLHEGVALMGGMTTPLSMLLVGAILAKSRLRALFGDVRVLPVIALRLLAMPLAAFAVLRLFVHNETMLGVLVVLAAMPVAALTVIFAEQYQGDTALASRLVALSTLLCLVSVPVMALLL